MRSDISVYHGVRHSKLQIYTFFACHAIAARHAMPQKNPHATRYHNCLIRWHYNSQVSQSGVRRIFWLLLLGFHFLILFEGDDIGEVSPYVCFLISVYGIFRHDDKKLRAGKTA